MILYYCKFYNSSSALFETYKYVVKYVHIFNKNSELSKIAVSMFSRKYITIFSENMDSINLFIDTYASKIEHNRLSTDFIDTDTCQEFIINYRYNIRNRSRTNLTSDDENRRNLRMLHAEEGKYKFIHISSKSQKTSLRYYIREEKTNKFYSTINPNSYGFASEERTFSLPII